MRTFLFKIPENNYEIDKYINSTDLKYLKPFVGKIRMRKMYGIILQKFVIKLNYNIPYKEILIKRNAYNKPYYNNKLFYNLSYSENYSLTLAPNYTAKKVT